MTRSLVARTAFVAAGAVALACAAATVGAAQAGTDSLRVDTGDVPRARYPFWPDSVRGPAARPGAIFPHRRVVAFYGNPRSTRMGILGQIPPAQMFARLEQQATEYAVADPFTPVQPALELIATVAQEAPGRDNMYRARMSDSLIEQVYRWANERGWLLILDIQVGRSSIAAEMAPLMKFLARPDIHLAIDPEFDVKPHQLPGKVIGSTDASDINHAVRVLGGLVDSLGLPPKMLVVHRFQRRMVTNAAGIALDPRVQVVMHMDGFGSPAQKRSSHQAYIEKEPVQWVGFKLFYKNDKPMLTPGQVVTLSPVPLFISYQ
jgi:hypothetical protein